MDDVFGGGGSTGPPPPVMTSTTDVGRENYRKAYEEWAAKRRGKRKNGQSKNVLGPVATPLGTAAETQARQLGN